TRRRPCSRTLRQPLPLRSACRCHPQRQAVYYRFYVRVSLDHEWSCCSSWMACAGITSIATPRPCQRSPPCASVVPGSLRRRLTFFRPTQPLGTRRCQPEPILACTESQGSAYTSARSADATTLSLEKCRKT